MSVLPYQQWVEEFKPLLGVTPRLEGFCYLVRVLLQREKPVIIETWTLRELDNWVGDGQSTRIWDWVVRKTGGQAVSGDCSWEACNLAELACPNVGIFKVDSVVWLREAGFGKPSLLYLDSYDYHLGQELNACMHQVAELAAIWDRLPSGCLIASDDSHGPNAGKPALTRRVFQALGIEPVVDGYIVVWRKP